MAEESAIKETPVTDHNGQEVPAPLPADAAHQIESVPPEVPAEPAALEEAHADAEVVAVAEESDVHVEPAPEPAEEMPPEAEQPAPEPEVAKKPARSRKAKAKAEPQAVVAPEAEKSPAPPSVANGAEAKPPEETKKWYVVKVQSGREESIKEAIERRVKIEGLEEYFGEILIPVEKEKVLVRGKRIERERKLFPGYIMAKVDFNDQILYLFRETSGVGDFVGGGPNTTPLPMTELEVARMTGQKFIQERQPGKTTGAAPYTIGERVKVKEGVFSNMEGDIKEVLEIKEKVRVELFVLGRPVPVELDYWEVELV